MKGRWDSKLESISSDWLHVDYWDFVVWEDL
jgi:hypothetical protein